MFADSRFGRGPVKWVIFFVVVVLAALAPAKGDDETVIIKPSLSVAVPSPTPVANETLIELQNTQSDISLMLQQLQQSADRLAGRLNVPHDPAPIEP